MAVPRREIVFIVGPIGCGKTWRAKQLASTNKESVLISLDDYMYHENGTLNDYGHWFFRCDHDSDPKEQHMRDAFESAFNNQCPLIVIDGPFTAKHVYMGFMLYVRHRSSSNLTYHVRIEYPNTPWPMTEMMCKKKTTHVGCDDYIRLMFNDIAINGKIPSHGSLWSLFKKTKKKQKKKGPKTASASDDLLSFNNF